MIVDFKSYIPVVLDKKVSLTIFRFYEVLLIHIEKSNHGNI